MEIRIAPYTSDHLAAIIRLSLRAWEPVFISLQNAMDHAVHHTFYPDWRVQQQAAVEQVCTAADAHVWVALADAIPIGFVAVKLHAEDAMGEVYMVAVDPAAQGQGVGTALTAWALDWMKNAFTLSFSLH